jgi:hypothetical protein
MKSVIMTNWLRFNMNILVLPINFVEYIEGLIILEVGYYEKMSCLLYKSTRLLLAYGIVLECSQRIRHSHDI